MTTAKSYKTALGNQDRTLDLRKDAITVTDPYKLNTTIEYADIDFKKLRSNA